MIDIGQWDRAIAAAHSAIGWAMLHLDNATIHGDDIDGHMIAGIMRQLSAAREPLAEHLGRP